MGPPPFNNLQTLPYGVVENGNNRINGLSFDHYNLPRITAVHGSNGHFETADQRLLHHYNETSVSLLKEANRVATDLLRHVVNSAKSQEIEMLNPICGFGVGSQYHPGNISCRPYNSLHLKDQRQATFDFPPEYQRRTFTGYAPGIPDTHPPMSTLNGLGHSSLPPTIHTKLKHDPSYHDMSKVDMFTGAKLPGILSSHINAIMRNATNAQESNLVHSAFPTHINCMERMPDVKGHDNYLEQITHAPWPSAHISDATYNAKHSPAITRFSSNAGSTVSASVRRTGISPENNKSNFSLPDMPDTVSGTSNAYFGDQEIPNARNRKRGRRNARNLSRGRRNYLYRSHNNLPGKPNKPYYDLRGVGTKRSCIDGDNNSESFTSDTKKSLLGPYCKRNEDNAITPIECQKRPRCISKWKVHSSKKGNRWHRQHKSSDISNDILSKSQSIVKTQNNSILLENMRGHEAFPNLDISHKPVETSIETSIGYSKAENVRKNIDNENIQICYIRRLATGESRTDNYNTECCTCDTKKSSPGSYSNITKDNPVMPIECPKRAKCISMCKVHTNKKGNRWDCRCKGHEEFPSSDFSHKPFETNIQDSKAENHVNSEKKIQNSDTREMLPKQDQELIKENKKFVETEKDQEREFMENTERRQTSPNLYLDFSDNPLERSTTKNWLENSIIENNYTTEMLPERRQDIIKENKEVVKTGKAQEREFVENTEEFQTFPNLSFSDKPLKPSTPDNLLKNSLIRNHVDIEKTVIDKQKSNMPLNLQKIHTLSLTEIGKDAKDISTSNSIENMQEANQKSSSMTRYISQDIHQNHKAFQKVNKTLADQMSQQKKTEDDVSFSMIKKIIAEKVSMKLKSLKRAIDFLGLNEELNMEVICRKIQESAPCQDDAEGIMKQSLPCCDDLAGVMEQSLCQDDAESVMEQSCQDDAEGVMEQSLLCQDDTESVMEQSCQDDAESVMKQSLTCQDDAEGVMEQSLSCQDDAESVMEESCQDDAESVMKQSLPCQDDAEGVMEQSLSCQDDTESVMEQSSYEDDVEDVMEESSSPLSRLEKNLKQVDTTCFKLHRTQEAVQRSYINIEKNKASSNKMNLCKELIQESPSVDKKDAPEQLLPCLGKEIKQEFDTTCLRIDLTQSVEQHSNVAGQKNNPLSDSLNKSSEKAPNPWAVKSQKHEYKPSQVNKLSSEISVVDKRQCSKENSRITVAAILERDEIFICRERETDKNICIITAKPTSEKHSKDRKEVSGIKEVLSRKYSNVTNKCDEKGDLLHSQKERQDVHCPENKHNLQRKTTNPSSDTVQQTAKNNIANTDLRHDTIKESFKRFAKEKKADLDRIRKKQILQNIPSCETYAEIKSGMKRKLSQDSAMPINEPLKKVPRSVRSMGNHFISKNTAKVCLNQPKCKSAMLTEEINPYKSYHSARIDEYEDSNEDSNDDELFEQFLEQMKPKPARNKRLNCLKRQSAALNTL